MDETNGQSARRETQARAGRHEINGPREAHGQGTPVREELATVDGNKASQCRSAAPDTGSMGRSGDKPGSIPYVELFMYRPHLRDWPDAALPPCYAIRPFRAGEEADWARIEHAVGEFATPELARRHFDEEFGGGIAEMEERCLFVVDERNVPVGTTTAWYGDWDGRTIGRIHWVAVVPEHQGKKLAKPLLAHALRTLARFHDRAYLSTQTTSWKAVGMYLDFGFEPALRLPGCADGWRLAERLLGRRIVTQDGSNGPGSQVRDLRGEP